jgi:hypothetical protein
MAEDYTPTNIEKVFELLDNKLVSLGIPGALSFVGITQARQGQVKAAAGYFVSAAGVWMAIKVGKKLAPKIDQLLDWGIGSVETSVTTVRADFTGQFLRQQAQLNEEFVTEGFNPDLTAIPLLEEVFVPLELSGSMPPGTMATTQHGKNLALQPEHLDIWELLRRSQKNRTFRQMVIQAQGGMGKTTLLRHIALIYGQRQHRRHRAPGLVPILLRLRDWGDKLTQGERLSLPQLITDHQIPKLWDGQENAPQPPDQWVQNLLTQGKALVMFDGFDEVPEAKRAEVSQWISNQMRQYAQSVFILTSRPAGYKDYAAKKPTIPLFVKKFTPAQQADFIRRWYLCQEKCVRSQKQLRNAKTAAKSRAEDLITQLDTRRQDLGYMAENPLLLNMLVTFHRLAPDEDLPRQRLELYRRICQLQLEDRPRARGIRMPLSYRKSMVLLQRLAFAMVRADRLTLPKQAILDFLTEQPLITQEEVEPQDWFKKIVEVSELLVEREPGEFEFPHASFQGYFAATLLAQPEDQATMQRYATGVLKSWNQPIWKETVLLYTAQLTPKLLNQVIRKACKQGSEAAELAIHCLKEYPRPEKIEDDLKSLDLKSLFDNLQNIAQDSKYQKLEELLKAQQWQEADDETYRLMITTVGKAEGQWFETEDLLNFPCKDLKAIDGLWVKYSQGKFGFSVQKQIYVDCGARLDGNYPGDKIWEAFCDRVGWRIQGKYVSYHSLKANLSLSPAGEFPVGGGGVGLERVGMVMGSLLSHSDL